jgi:hypothetical protein
MVQSAASWTQLTAHPVTGSSFNGTGCVGPVWERDASRVFRSDRTRSDTSHNSNVRQIERVARFTTPEEEDKFMLEKYRAMTPNQRVEMLREMMSAWHGASVRRLERTYRFVQVERS